MATYYWVGGSGTWNNSSTANWATVTGGAGGFGPPTATDNINFDANSGTGTCTTAAGATCQAFTFNSANMVVTLGADLPTTNQLTLTLGTLNLVSYKLTALYFSSTNSNVRTLNFGTGNLTLTGNGTTVYTTAISTNFAFSGTPVVNLTYAGSTGTRTITTGTLTEATAFSFNVTAGSDIVNAPGYSKNLNFTGFLGSIVNSTRIVYGDLTISSGMTITAGAGGWTFAGTSGVQKVTTNGNAMDVPITQNGVGGTVQLQDNLTIGSTRGYTFTAGTLDLTGNSGNWTLSVGAWSSANTNTRAIAFGTGKIVVTLNNLTIWNMGTSDNLTVTGTPVVELSYSGAVGTRTVVQSVTSGGVEANAISFKVTAGTDTVAFSSSNNTNFKNVDFTGFAGTFTSASYRIFGSLTLSTGMTITGGATTTTFAGTSTSNITSNGKTYDRIVTINGIGGTFAFQDAFTQGTTRAFTITNGTVQLKAGTTNTVGSFVTSGTNVKYLQSTTVGTQATISDTVGITTPTYLNVKDISAQGGAIWNAYTVNNNADAGNNSGWNFGGNFMPMFG